MRAGLKAGWHAWQHLQYRGYQYIWSNLLWVALSLPVITLPAAWAGLIRLSYNAQRQPNVSFDEFWSGVRENLKRGVVIGIFNVVIVTVNVVNLQAYQHETGTGVAALRVVWLLALFGWFAIQLYVWPLLYEMEQPNLIGAYRNAAVMILLNLRFTFCLWIICGVVVVVSTAFPVAWLLLTGSALAVIGTTAVRDRLQAAGYDRSSETVEIQHDEVPYDVS